MEDFLIYLAKQKHRYYRFLYEVRPQAYTNEECFERIQHKCRYEEIISIIAMLPNKEQLKVKEIYKEISE